jgi:hypothetical protein
MRFGLAALLLLAAGARGCVTYEYEHEFWLETDGSGTVHVTGRPSLWRAFKPGPAGEGDAPADPEAARRYFERAGLTVRRATLTHRRGQPYLFVAADFDDVNRLSASGAFPDLEIALARADGRLRLSGGWRRPPSTGTVPPADEAGWLAVRFHLPSKVYMHDNAEDGVERGNILSWRSEVKPALDGRRLRFGAVLDERSILRSAVVLFASAIAAAGLLLAAIFAWVVRRGRRALASGEGSGAA